MRKRGCVRPDVASAIASAAPKATSTSTMSRWLRLSTWWCEHRPVYAHSHATGRTGHSAAETPDGVTITERHAPLLLCKRWSRQVSAIIEHLCEASSQDVAMRCRDKLDVAFCVVRNHGLSLHCLRPRFPTDRRFQRRGDGRLPSTMLVGVVTATSMYFPVWIATATDKQHSTTTRPFQMRVGREFFEQAQRGNGTRDIPPICPKKTAVRLHCLKTGSFVENIGAAFHARNLVTPSKTKCESRQTDEAQQRPVCAPC